MRIIKPELPDSRWQKAAVIASFWAAFEIVAGSFLHNLRVPMTGTILSFTSVVLMVSFVSAWKQEGLIWRAGLICALLKSISPSAIIFGPMIGIFSEALMLEIFLRIFGLNLIGYITGGAMAVMSTLIHKVVSLLILYGLDLVKLAGALYKFAVKQLGMEYLSASTLIIIISLIYIVSGMLAALIGYMVGRSDWKQRHPSGENTIADLSNENTFFTRSENEHYSLWLLVFNFIVVILMMIFLNKGLTWYTIVPTVLYVTFVIFRYRNSLRRLKKPGLWIQFLIITLISSVLLNGLSTGTIFGWEGLLIGITMNIRAIVVVVGFSAISAELRNPVIHALSYRGGLSVLYQSVNLAFSALPAVIATFPGIRTFLAHPLRTFSKIIPQAESIIQAFKKVISSRNHVVIISGDRQEGKTTFLKEVVAELRRMEIEATGFFAVGVHENGKRIGFDLCFVDGETVMPLCRERKDTVAQSYHKFVFSDEALDEGNRVLDPVNVGNRPVVVVDEVGPIELKNQGWAKGMKKLLTHSEAMQIWTVRRHMVEQVARAWPIGAAYIFDIAEDKVSGVADFIHNHNKGKSDNVSL